jgi:hypothetical protein
MALYPTADEVLAAPELTYRPEVVRFVFAWKREWQGRRRTPDAIGALLRGLADVYQTPVDVTFMSGASDSADLRGHITLNADHLSVITALHEFAHHRFGASEMKACRWSVQLFRKTFPRTFARGRFVGHVFVVNEARAAQLEQMARLMGLLVEAMPADSLEGEADRRAAAATSDVTARFDELLESMGRAVRVRDDEEGE